ncbi:hypothetical protein [Alkalicoccus chagannorensis]|uniref:hypothetical protein n=1 Tax=Alkalicoccus chagannorensis TaxID=427072 RepID=UPI0012EB803F|nr:hypothetical protein [Alkalicoccus chagannorensis]
MLTSKSMWMATTSILPTTKKNKNGRQGLRVLLVLKKSLALPLGRTRLFVHHDKNVSVFIEADGGFDGCAGETKALCFRRKACGTRRSKQKMHRASVLPAPKLVVG